MNVGLPSISTAAIAPAHSPYSDSEQVGRPDERSAEQRNHVEPGIAAADQLDAISSG